MLYFLQVLRGVAASLVMLFHYRGFMDGAYGKTNLSHILFENGDVGVDIFFVISGFIIVYSTRKKEHASCIDFIIRRFFRVVPLAWLATLTFYLLDRSAYDNATLFKSLAFIPLWNKAPPAFGYSLYVIIWTISYELFFYVVFALALALTHRFRTLLASLLIGACIYAFQVLLTGGFSLNAYHEPVPDFVSGWFPPQILALFGNPMSLEFVVGMVLAEIFERYAGELAKLRPTMIKLSAFLFFLIFLYCYFTSTQEHHHGLLTMLGFGVVCLVMACLLLNILKRESRPHEGFWFFLGAISYSLYLVHDGITEGLLKKLPHVYARISAHQGVITYLMYGCISIALAGCVHKFLELPLQNLGKRIIRLRASRQARSGQSMTPSWLPQFKVPIAIIAGLAVAVLMHHLHSVKWKNFMPANSSFEQGRAGWKMGNVDVFEAPSIRAVDGGLSAHLVTSGVQFVESGEIPVERGKRYWLDAWVYVKKGAVRLELLADSDTTLLAEEHNYETDGWIRLTARTKDPVNCDFVTVGIDDYHTKSEIYIDAVRLRSQ
jgi:exopolysaccharide production protein ExoZ